MTPPTPTSQRAQPIAFERPHDREAYSKRRKPLLITPESPYYVPMTRFSPPFPPKKLTEDSKPDRQTSSLIANYGSLTSSLIELSLPEPQKSSRGSQEVENDPMKFPLLPGEAGRLVSSENQQGISSTLNIFINIWLRGRLTGLTGILFLHLVIIIKVNDGPFRVGRHVGADLTINKPTISSWHCKLYAVGFFVALWISAWCYDVWLIAESGCLSF